MTAKTFTIGENLTVNRLGYGAMRLTGQPGNLVLIPRGRTASLCCVAQLISA